MKLTTTIADKIKTFALLLECQQIRGLKDSGLDCEANINNARTSVHPGRKYVNVDVGGSGRFMVEIETGIIYGIKAYGQIHKGHSYGTLDTTHEWDWTKYYPTPLSFEAVDRASVQVCQAPQQRTVTLLVAVHVKLAEDVDPDTLTLEMDHARCFPKSGEKVVGHVVAHETESVSYE